MRTLNKETPIFSATIDGSGHLNYGLSKEAVERLEKVVSRFEGTAAMNDRLRENDTYLNANLEISYGRMIMTTVEAGNS